MMVKLCCTRERAQVYVFYFRPAVGCCVYVMGGHGITMLRGVCRGFQLVCTWYDLFSDGIDRVVTCVYE